MFTEAIKVAKLLETLQDTICLGQVEQLGAAKWAKSQKHRDDIIVMSYTESDVVFVAEGHFFQIYHIRDKDMIESWDIRVHTSHPNEKDGECSCIACTSLIMRQG